jgi:membrane protein DedA with SNARE-associated domain
MFDFIVDFVSSHGYLGLFLLMVSENIFPPIPSELIMPLAGFAAARGDLNVLGVVLTGTAGSVAGSLPWYLVGRHYGKYRARKLAARYGRWLTVSVSDVNQALVFFDRHGSRAILFGRLVPAVRTLISVPAGIADMPLWRFVGWSAAGSALWSGLLTVLGFLLQSQYTLVAKYMDPVSKGIVAAIVLIYLYRLFGRKPR